MRTLNSLIAVALLLPGPSMARDQSTPPELGSAAEGSEPSPATNPGKARDRFESESRPKSDELLATAVHDALGNDGRVRTHDVRVSADDGVVQLTGWVPRQADRDVAEEVARGVAGVRDVRNRLVVPATVPTPDSRTVPSDPLPQRMPAP